MDARHQRGFPIAGALQEHPPDRDRVVRRLDDVGGRDGAQGPRQPFVRPRAVHTGFEMTLRPHEVWAVLIVVMQDQFVVGEVVHWLTPCAASARRSFRTARKMCCLAALFPMPTVSEISAIDRPSKCRSANVTRSSGLIPSIAAATSLRQPSLAARHSRSGFVGSAVSSTSVHVVGAYTTGRRR